MSFNAINAKKFTLGFTSAVKIIYISVTQQAVNLGVHTKATLQKITVGIKNFFQHDLSRRFMA